MVDASYQPIYNVYLQELTTEHSIKQASSDSSGAFPKRNPNRRASYCTINSKYPARV